MTRSDFASAQSCVSEQNGSPNYRPPAFQPAFPMGGGPKVLFDEAHHNFHTISPILGGRYTGRYFAFGELLKADGYRVSINKSKFTKETLKGFSVLVISGAAPAPFVVCNKDRGIFVPNSKSSGPAFTAEEVTAVRQWVHNGGSLLLATDHVPFGFNAGMLSAAFGVVSSDGLVVDSQRETYTKANRGIPADGLHPIISETGFGPAGLTVRTFGAGALISPTGATVLLRYSGAALNAQMDIYAWIAFNEILRLIGSVPTASVVELLYALSLMNEGSVKIGSAGFQAAGVAVDAGKGRVVVLADQAMLTEQEANGELTGGLVVSGSDLGNTQFVLNVMRWLGRR